MSHPEAAGQPEGGVGPAHAGPVEVEDIADALGESQEKVRRVRVALGIPDAREIRRAKGARPGASALANRALFVAVPA